MEVAGRYLECVLSVCVLCTSNVVCFQLDAAFSIQPVLLVYKIAQGQMWNSVMLKLFQNISLVLGHICMFKPSDTAELSVCNHFLLCQQTSFLPYHEPQ